MTVPYAIGLAELIPPIAVRLRRDFGALLNLIRAHAVLHQATRKRDEQGRIVATVDDYAVVRDLIDDLVSEGVEATVSPTVRETVQAVAEAPSAEGLSISRLAAALQVDKSVASRRWQAAREGGYLKNLEDGRGKPAKIVIADRLPDEVQVLPTAEHLAEHSTVAGGAAGAPAPPSANGNSPIPGDPGFLSHLFAAFEAEQVTELEWQQISKLHARLVATP